MPVQSANAGGHKEGKKLTAASSGFEGREEMLGRAMSVVLKSLNETKPYHPQVWLVCPRGSRAELAKVSGEGKGVAGTTDSVNPVTTWPGST